MSPTIKQVVIFKASPHDVYEALMDSQKHSAFTGSKAEISREIGGTFTAYDEYIFGKNIELIPDKKIVQDWRASDWSKDYYSRVTFSLIPVHEGTRLDFTHANIPEGREGEYKQGWIDNYWEPLKKYLEK
jgi:activator of HSP90 ATPase